MYIYSIIKIKTTFYYHQSTLIKGQANQVVCSGTFGMETPQTPCRGSQTEASCSREWLL